MADVVDSATRSRMMSGIRGSDTKLEVAFRKRLYARGYRYRLHERKLPGRPDLVLRSRNAVIFINGCFWHAHDCHLMKWPSTRQEFWRDKLARNRLRDERSWEQLELAGWRVLCVWECATRGPGAVSLDDVVAQSAEWLESGRARGDIRGPLSLEQ